MLRAVIALGLVGLLLVLFTFQSIADGNVGSAMESGLAGLAILGGAYLVARRTLFRMRGPHRRRSWARLTDGEERAVEVAAAKACVACREEIVIGEVCNECGLPLHVNCKKRHSIEAHELSVGAYR